MTQMDLEKRMVDLEGKIQLLEDIKEIEYLLNQYVFWLANSQWDEVVECFTENANAEVYHNGFHRGKTEIRKMFLDIISKKNEGKGRDGHSVFPPVISVEGNKARGQWMMYVWISDPDTGDAKKWFNGKYDNEFEKVDGKWKISSLKWTYPWPVTSESYPR
jgi:hypothetical protein